MDTTIRANALLRHVTIVPILVDGKRGPKPAFALQLTRVSADKVEQPREDFMVTPEHLVLICGLLQQVLHAHGLEIPSPPTEPRPTQ